MIDIALSLLKTELTNYLSVHGLTQATNHVVIDNIGMLEPGGGNTLADRVVISVVNVEEESTLKNQPARRHNPPANTIYLNPPIYLNLYILFTSTFTGTTGYSTGLTWISNVIQFMQSKNSFSSQSTIGDSNISSQMSADQLNLWFTMELYTLTFEQLNHLWGSLGGRQVPFVMYKLRLVAIAERNIVRTAPVILQINSDISPSS